MATYTTFKSTKSTKTGKTESEKATSRETNAVKRSGTKAYERKPFNLLG